MLLILVLSGSDCGAAFGNDQVELVYPATSEVHENLLRISIKFREKNAMASVEALKLWNDEHKEIENPFLKEELWSPDQKILTVLLNPGRVKTGLNAHESLGRPLHSGHRVKLTINGKEIAEWKITATENSPLDPNRWEISKLRKGTRDPIVIKFRREIDSLGRDFIKIVSLDKIFEGQAELSRDAMTWTFTPKNNWISRCEIYVNRRLEDPYGNQVGSSFENINQPHRDFSNSIRVPVKMTEGEL